jgi:WhiB family transcriptional regulator, redox-sensing transcriptional regulator
MLAQWSAVPTEYEEQLDQEVDWSLARCRDGSATMLNLFFSEQLDDIARAKAICALCPLAEPCLEGAIARREPWGVWGGQLFFNGKILAFKRKRGRPPKNAQTQLTA